MLDFFLASFSSDDMARPSLVFWFFLTLEVPWFEVPWLKVLCFFVVRACGKQDAHHADDTA